MWKLISASALGTSHQRRGEPCQDCGLARTIQANGDTILVACCSDGSGSAVHSQIGSQLACENVARVVAEALQSGLRVEDIDRERVLLWHREVLTCLEKEAIQRLCAPRELACTLLTAVIGDHVAVFSQIGDGAIVVSADDSYDPVFWPQSGEYINATNFLTDDGFEQRLEFCSWNETVDDVALFTDGLQMLVLHYAERTAHPPFFAPLFKRLRESAATEELQASLKRFLDSARVNERTDDDKTLIVATRRAADASADTL
jgi:Protein phosphatase 2C